MGPTRWGEYTDADGKEKARRSARSARRTGQLAPEQVQEAAKEAVRWRRLRSAGGVRVRISSRMVSVESKQLWEYCRVLITHMNPDLAMGDEVLKKTGAGNLFMVFGEPDLEVQTQKDGRICRRV